MPILTLTDEQTIALVRQLPPNQQTQLFTYLLTQHWPAWADLAREADNHARMIAEQRGRQWDQMTDRDREEFIDDLVHEAR